MSLEIHEKAAVGFNRASDAYERGRPEYPQAAVDFLIHTLEVHANSVVADVGAGTGKFTRLLLGTQALLIAVEPVAGMRTKFRSLFPDIEVLNGTAEAMPLPDRSISAVVVAQAFHWFNGPEALKEIHRILKAKGKLGLIWNARDEAYPVMQALTKIIDRYQGNSPRYRSMEWQKAFTKEKLFSSLEKREFPYRQTGSLEMVLDRVASISFIASLEDDKRRLVLKEVSEMMQIYLNAQGEVEFPYRTDVYWCAAR